MIVVQFLSFLLGLATYGLIFVGVIATAITAVAVFLGGPLLTIVWGLVILGSGLLVGQVNRSLISRF